MKDFFCDSVYFGVLLTISAYGVGNLLHKRFSHPLVNPMLIAIALIISLLLVFSVPYGAYATGANLITYLLTPATVCLALPLHQQMTLLRKNHRAVMAGIMAGVVSSCLTILTLSILMRFDHQTFITLLPKSITTAIGMCVAEELGGYVSVAVVVIVLTGVLGNIFAEQFLRLVHIDEPIARGIAIGSASHAVGTARAMEMGAIEGAMSSLSIVVSGVLTVIVAPFFAELW